MKTIERLGFETTCQSCDKKLLFSKLSGMNSPYTFAYSDSGCTIVVVDEEVESDDELRRLVPSQSIDPSRFSVSNPLDCPYCGSALVNSGGASSVQQAIYLDGMHYINRGAEYLVKIKPQQ